MKQLMIIATLGFLLVSLPAHAVKITNLDEVPHTLIINNGGEVSEVTIQPGMNYFTFGPMVDLQMNRKSKVQRAAWNAEYAIWPGGKLILQRIREPHRN